MADEPDDIEPDLLRDRLLMQAEHGEITGKQAEASGGCPWSRAVREEA